MTNCEDYLGIFGCAKPPTVNRARADVPVLPRYGHQCMGHSNQRFPSTVRREPSIVGLGNSPMLVDCPVDNECMADRCARARTKIDEVMLAGIRIGLVAYRNGQRRDSN